MSPTSNALKIKSKIDLLADKGYNSATDIAECYADNMNANVCMDIEEFDICVETDEDTPKQETHQNGRCVYLKERNVCICPMGEILYPATTELQNTALNLITSVNADYANTAVLLQQQSNLKYGCCQVSFQKNTILRIFTSNK